MINFSNVLYGMDHRLSWGVLVLYHEIPTKFLPFLHSRYEGNLSVHESKISMDGMTNSELTVCEFLMADDEHKTKQLKIIPSAVQGPFLVRNIGVQNPSFVPKRIPVNWTYNSATNGKCEYLEASLDVASYPIAKDISEITGDLGFLLQGNSEIKLPEQMLAGVRLHSLEPVNVAAFPLTEDRDICELVGKNGDDLRRASLVYDPKL